MFLVNSRRHLVSATRFRLKDGLRAPLIPKLRGQFAEFLEESYPDRLRLLTQPICVDLRYGQLCFNGCDVISWQCGVNPVGEDRASPPHHASGLYEGRICLSLTLSAWRRHSNSSRGLSSCVTPQPPHSWRRNINLLPIGYAFRPHLRVPANPTLIYIGSEPLGFRRAGFSPAFAATHARILTTLQSMPPFGSTSSRRVRSPTAC